MKAQSPSPSPLRSPRPGSMRSRRQRRRGPRVGRPRAADQRLRRVRRSRAVDREAEARAAGPAGSAGRGLGLDERQVSVRAQRTRVLAYSEGANRKRARLLRRSSPARVRWSTPRFVAAGAVDHPASPSRAHTGFGALAMAVVLGCVAPPCTRARRACRPAARSPSGTNRRVERASQRSSVRFPLRIARRAAVQPATVSTSRRERDQDDAEQDARRRIGNAARRAGNARCA